MSLLINNNYGQVNHIENSVVNFNPQGKMDVEHKGKDKCVQKKENKSTPFVPDFITFTKEQTSDYNIIALYQELLKVKWIEDGNPDEFTALFDGKNTECRIIWSGKVGKDNLYALFKMMVDNHFIRLPKGHSLQRIVESHFVDANGNYITGIDSGKPSKSALSTIEQMKKILAARQTFDD